MPNSKITRPKLPARRNPTPPTPRPPTRKNHNPVNQKPSRTQAPPPHQPEAQARNTPPSAAIPNPEKPNPVSQKQKHTARLQHVQHFIKANPQIFARQGTVAATWRTYKGKRLGPYYQLTYRDQDRQHWLYLGRSEQLAHQVREFLHNLHRPRDQHRLNRRLQSQARTSLRLAKTHLKQLLAPRGITLKGWEFRGIRKFRAQYYPLPRLTQTKCIHARAP